MHKTITQIHFDVNDIIEEQFMALNGSTKIFMAMEVNEDINRNYSKMHRSELTVRAAFSAASF